MNIKIVRCLALAALMAPLGALHAQSVPTFVGDFCWSDSTQGILKLGVLSYGNGHFPVNGSLIVSDGSAPVFGTAELEDGAIVATLNTFASQLLIEFDPATLEGLAVSVTIEFDAQGGVSHVRRADTLTPTPCP